MIAIDSRMERDMQGARATTQRCLVLCQQQQQRVLLLYRLLATTLLR